MADVRGGLSIMCFIGLDEFVDPNIPIWVGIEFLEEFRDDIPFLLRDFLEDEIGLQHADEVVASLWMSNEIHNSSIDFQWNPCFIGQAGLLFCETKDDSWLILRIVSFLLLSRALFSWGRWQAGWCDCTAILNRYARTLERDLFVEDLLESLLSYFTFEGRLAG